MAVLSTRSIALDTRLAAVLLALILATVSMPMLSGWVVSGDRCAITADICHSAQTVDVSNGQMFASPPQLSSMYRPTRETRLAVNDCYAAMAGRLGEAPDLPPPKSRS